MDTKEDIEYLLKSAFIKLVSDESKERLEKLIKNILNEFQNEIGKSMINGTCIQNSEEGLEQMTIEDLEKLQMKLRKDLITKKDLLFSKLTIRNRLKERLTKIFKLIDQNEESIKEYLLNDTRCLTPADLIGDTVGRWKENKNRINRKFQCIEQLLNELNI